MEEELKRMSQLKLEGLCCSSILIQMGLDLRGEENLQLVKSARALCNGIHSGMTCGALTGAAIMLALFDATNVEMTQELARWFRYELCDKYGSAECEKITHGSPYEKAAVCPGIMRATYARAKELLIEYGYIEPQFTE